jgi:hypothetical protein
MTELDIKRTLYVQMKSFGEKDMIRLRQKIPDIRG